jgi:hypothetical protein
MHDLLFLAHGGEGATWQALVTMLSLGVMAVFLLVVLGRLTFEKPDDALLPLAGVAVLAALSPSLSSSLSDWIGWALPAGVVLLTALGVHLFTGLPLRPVGWPAGAAVVAAVVSSVLLYQPIVNAWHPVPVLVFTAQRDDAVVTIIRPVDGEQLSADGVLVEVAVTGATLLPDGLPKDVEPPDDPEELADLKVLVDGSPFTPEIRETCTADAPCTTISFPVPLEAGAHEVSVELLTAVGVTFEQVIFDQVSFEVVAG